MPMFAAEMKKPFRVAGPRGLVKPVRSDSTSSQSGTRERSRPPLGGASDGVDDDEIFSLVSKVDAEDGLSYPPSWAAVAHVAKQKGYVTERDLRLYMTGHGRQLLAARAQPRDSVVKYTMTKIDRVTRLALKDLSHETGVPMQEAIAHIIQAVHANRDALTRAARAANLDHPWEGVGAVLRSKK